MIRHELHSGKVGGNSPTVLLTTTSWWPVAARLAISLAQRGFRVSAVCPPSGHPLSKTNAVESTFAYSALAPLQSLETAIAETRPDIVIPADDRATAHLHALYRASEWLRPLIERSLGAPRSFAVVSSRFLLLEAARLEGIAVPPTSLVESVAQLASTVTSFPTVLKADQTWGGHGVAIAKSLGEAQTFIDASQRPVTTPQMLKRLLVNRDPFWIGNWRSRSVPAVIAQNFVPGRPANCAALAKDGAILAMISVEVLHAQGATGPANIVRIIDSPDMRRAAEKLAKRLGLSGFFGLDFVIQAGTGLPYLIEMNARVTPPSHVPAGPGRDLPGALWTALTREECVGTGEVQPIDTIAYFPQAWHWCRDTELLENSYHDIPQGEDALLHELSKTPYPDRGLLARLYNRCTRMTFDDRAGSGVTFPTALQEQKHS